MEEKKSNKSMPLNASSIMDPNDPTEGGRTVIFRDAMGEVVLSSTHEDDTLERMYNLAISRGMIQLPKSPGGPRSYHG